MKVIVTGATGRAGREIVKQCIADARITKIVILTRRAVAGEVESNPKTEVIMHQDFSRYPDELLRRLEGAEACLWAIGARVEEVSDDKMENRRIGVEYPLAAARVMCDLLADRTPDGGKFNFVFCSDKHAERTQTRSLLFLGDSRRHKGEAEKPLCDIASLNPARFSMWILRPSAFATGDAAPKKRRLVGGVQSTIEPSQFARAAVRVACEGWKDRVIENDALLKM